MSALGDIVGPVIGAVTDPIGTIGGAIGGQIGGAANGWLTDAENNAGAQIDRLNATIKDEVVSLSIYVCIFLVALVCVWALLAPSDSQLSQVGTTAETAAKVAATG